MRCIDTIAQYLFYTFVIDFTLEMLDLIHRIYEADESFRSLDFMVHTRLWTSQVDRADPDRDGVPLLCLAQLSSFNFVGARAAQAYLRPAGVPDCWSAFSPCAGTSSSAASSSPRAFSDYTTYKMGFATREGLLTAIMLMLLPFMILWILVKLLPPWTDAESIPASAANPVHGTS